MAAAAAAAASPALVLARASSERFPHVTLQLVLDNWRGTAALSTAVEAIRGGDVRCFFVANKHVEAFQHSKKSAQLWYYVRVVNSAENNLVAQCSCKQSASGMCSHGITQILLLALMNRVRSGDDAWPTWISTRPTPKKLPGSLNKWFPSLSYTLVQALEAACGGFSAEETSGGVILWAYDAKLDVRVERKNFGSVLAAASHEPLYQDAVRLLQQKVADERASRAAKSAKVVARVAAPKSQRAEEHDAAAPRKRARTVEPVAADAATRSKRRNVELPVRFREDLE